jgi:hypothetical protein
VRNEEESRTKGICYTQFKKRTAKLEWSYLSSGNTFYCILLKEDMWENRSNKKTRKKKQT